MTDYSPVMIAVAPNGARKTKQDQPRLPITARELAKTASACLHAGACMLHLHVRDVAQGHSLDSSRYKEAIKIIRDSVVSDLRIQITAEAVGIYGPEEQMQVVREVRPEAVSLAIKELCPPGGDEKIVANFFAWLSKESIAPQYILYSVEEIRRFYDLKTRGIIPAEHNTILLVLGRYTENQQSEVKDLQPLLAVVNRQSCWWLCAFGATESDCMRTAMGLGGHCRIGFENNLLLPDGKPASANEAMVALCADNCRKLGHRPAKPAEARELMAMN